MERKDSEESKRHKRVKREREVEMKEEIKMKVRIEEEIKKYNFRNHRVYVVIYFQRLNFDCCCQAFD